MPTMKQLHPQNADNDKINGEHVRIRFIDNILRDMSAPIGPLISVSPILDGFSGAMGIWSPPLSDIELNDIRLSEEEYTRGEAPIFDSVEEMLTYICEENNEPENEES
jgi:hypothetical protein